MRRRDIQPGGHGDPVRRHSARSGLDLDDDQRPGGDPLLLLCRRGGRAGRAHRSSGGRSRTTSSRSTWRSTPGSTPRSRRSRSSWTSSSGPPSTLPSGTRSRSPGITSGRPDPRRRRSWRSRWLTASATWSMVSPGDSRWTVRSPALVLLGRPQRLLRGDREAAGRATHLGSRTAGEVRRQRPTHLEDAISLPDGRRHPYGAAAAQQCRPGRLPGLGRRAGWNPVAAHQRARRDAGASHRGVGAHRTPHPADPSL